MRIVKIIPLLLLSLCGDNSSVAENLKVARLERKVASTPISNADALYAVAERELAKYFNLKLKQASEIPGTDLEVEQRFRNLLNDSLERKTASDQLREKGCANRNAPMVSAVRIVCQNFDVVVDSDAVLFQDPNTTIPDLSKNVAPFCNYYPNDYSYQFENIDASKILLEWKTAIESSPSSVPPSKVGFASMNLIQVILPQLSWGEYRQIIGSAIELAAGKNKCQIVVNSDKIILGPKALLERGKNITKDVLQAIRQLQGDL